MSVHELSCLACSACVPCNPQAEHGEARIKGGLVASRRWHMLFRLVEISDSAELLLVMVEIFFSSTNASSLLQQFDF
jgi:hypothetical protein